MKPVRRLPPIDTDRIRTVPLRTIRRKVSTGDLAIPPKKGRSFRSFTAGLPRQLAAVEFNALADAMAKAAKARRTVLWMIGAHVIKVGLAPVLIEMMRKRTLTALALNGAGAIHDFEMAFAGTTSEDVASGLKDGSFGMSKETGDFFGTTLRSAGNRGFGAAVGVAMDRMKLPHRRHSLIWNAREMGIPVTVHVALGTDIVHQQPPANGADIGRESMNDFRTLASVAATLEGGVVLNVGSAVILPEVFLKALTIARNLGYTPRKFTAANLDMIQHYRPRLNVVERPTQHGHGRRITLTGHHELMIPLLAQAVVERL